MWGLNLKEGGRKEEEMSNGERWRGYKRNFRVKWIKRLNQGTSHPSAKQYHEVGRWVEETHLTIIQIPNTRSLSLSSHLLLSFIFSISSNSSGIGYNRKEKRRKLYSNVLATLLRTFPRPWHELRNVQILHNRKRPVKKEMREPREVVKSLS